MISKQSPYEATSYRLNADLGDVQFIYYFNHTLCLAWHKNLTTSTAGAHVTGINISQPEDVMIVRWPGNARLVGLLFLFWLAGGIFGPFFFFFFQEPYCSTECLKSHFNHIL